MPVSGALPVLVNVNVCVGHVPPTPENPVVHVRAADVVHEGGVSAALITGAVPVPLSVTGEPVTGTSAGIVSVPLAAPDDVGVNTTLIVQVAPLFNVAPHVPLAFALPVGREKPGLENTSVPRFDGMFPVLLSVRVCAGLVAPTAAVKVNGPPVTASFASGG